MAGIVDNTLGIWEMKKGLMLLVFLFIGNIFVFGGGGQEPSWVKIEGVKVGGSDFLIDIDRKGIIAGYDGWDTDIVIPTQIGGIRITGIGEGAFSSMDLTGVTIPQGIISIGQGAFSKNKLTNLDIPEGISIGNYAFANNQLMSITIGNNVSIGTRAFNNNQITSLTMGNGVSVASEAFSGNQLTRLTMGNGVSIGNNAFSNNKLTNLSIPDEVSIGSSAFANNQLTSLTIGNRVSVGSSAFTSNQLARLTIGDGVSLDSGAFAGNPLTSLTIGGGGSIGNNAFANHRLTNLTLGANNNFIDFDNAALGRGLYYDYNCNERKAGTYNAGANYPSRNDGDYTFIESRYGAVITEYRGSGGNRLIIPRELNGMAVKGIGDRAFREKNISRMQLPDSLVFIGREAFYRNQLTSVTIPNGVTSIGTGAFHRNELTEVNFAGNRRVVTVEMWDSSGNSWDGDGTLRINVNGGNFQYAKAIGSGGKDFLFVSTGDEVIFYWVAGSSQGENAFAVYYSDNPPNPTFDPRSGTRDTSKVLLYRRYGDLEGTTKDTRLGAFTVP